MGGQAASKREAEAPLATILVVDDNEANRALAQETLEDEGYRVVLATGGAEGIQAFEDHGPDCVLVDVRMPDIDGFTVCERIRASARGAETPVLFLTALRDVETFDRALLAGGDDFLTKPVRPTEIVVRVQTALKLRKVKVELREHFDRLKRQRDDLQRLQLQKERLMAFVVHDLKNPVNSMDLHAQLLLRDRNLSLDAKESAAQIRADARELTRMILNLLDLAKADEGRLAPRVAPVALVPLVDAVFVDLAAKAAARDVRLEASLDVDEVGADDDLLRRMLTNLVENAIRYAPTGTAVRVVAARDGAAIDLRVADAGQGLPQEMRSKVFDAFVQVDAGERVVARSGRGLGLAFCKLVAEAHGGAIRVEDASPGAIFCVRLPDAP